MNVKNTGACELYCWLNLMGKFEEGHDAWPSVCRVNLLGAEDVPALHAWTEIGNESESGQRCGNRKMKSIFEEEKCEKYNFHKPNFRNGLEPWQWWCIPLIPTLKRQRLTDHCEFEDSLVYKEFQDSQSCYTKKLWFKKQKTNSPKLLKPRKVIHQKSKLPTNCSSKINSTLLYDLHCLTFGHICLTLKHV